MNSIISFIIVLGLLIIVHEFGHFILAKLFNVKVLKFSIGFGPKMFGRRYGETEYLISAFPLGGYVKMFGEQRDEEIPAREEERSFSAKPVWQRFCIVAAGPVSNLLFAVFLFFMIFAIAGLPTPVDNTVIGAVTAASPAETAGLKAGDRIISINGKKTDEWMEVANLIANSEGKPVELLIERQGERLAITGHPDFTPSRNIFGEEIEKRYMLGISRSQEVIYEKVSLWEAIKGGFAQTWTLIYLTIMGIVKMIQAVIPASELGGPIMIAQLAGKQMEAGWINLIYFMALISVNLGILNLLPIPILDGGHLMFFSYEALLRRPMSQRTMEICQQIGLVILVTLMVFVFYNDLVRLFT
ncbi:MAG: RIP metalloprotease RseP [Desulfurivibrionaceae bacterium]|nr:RIP metalloprotease RseP [Desulfobulbales bacterium]MDT8334198.1 RIP metalloprotease RseP [Desulfurivibrionaceae bacterium]